MLRDPLTRCRKSIMLIGFIRNRRLRVGLLSALALSLVAAACGGDDDDDAGAASDESVAQPADTTGTTAASSGNTAPAESEPATLRLGYFPNVTHAPAIIGVETGLFAEALGSNVTLEVETFNSGTEVTEAMFSGSLDASFIGPNPAINGYAKSGGEALRIVAGTTSGGASLVVRDGIESVEDLAGTKLATPSLGNTQDVALRAWLQDQGYETDTAGGGDVHITPQDNADTLTAFETGAIDGAWVPEPWATRLVNEGGGHVLLNEQEIWPDGKFVTTHLIVTTEFLDEHPAVVRNLISGLAAAIDEANGDAAAAQTIVNDGIENVTTSRLADETISGAWENLEFTLDPIASSLQTSADHAVAAGLLDPVDLKSPGIYDLTLLNEVLGELGEPAASAL
jgi:NitT/TauT family transport system substrate-binding protein